MHDLQTELAWILPIYKYLRSYLSIFNDSESLWRNKGVTIHEAHKTMHIVFLQCTVHHRPLRNLLANFGFFDIAEPIIHVIIEFKHGNGATSKKSDW